MDNSKNLLRKYPPSTLVLILFFTGSLLFICFALLHENAMKNAVREDGIIENLQAILYLLGAVVWFYAASINPRDFKGERRRVIFYILFGGVFLFIFLEEISWGQRIFGFSTPTDLRELNMQGETNIHNIGTEDSMMWLNVLQALLFAAVGIMIPLLDLMSNKIHVNLMKLRLPIVNHNMIACFGISLNFYYEPGFHWSVPIRIACLIAPIILILSRRLQWLIEKFKYPLFQMFALISTGFIIIALNLNIETANYLKNNVAWEVRELFLALALVFFATYEAYRVLMRRNNPLTTDDKMVPPDSSTSNH
jgi:hypothetical protein